MLISCLPLSLVFVEIASWTILIIFWLWLMDRGIFVHRWCGCSDNAMIASILFLMITGIVTQFLLFYVVKCSSEAIDAMFAVRAWADSIDNKEAQTLLHLPVVDHSIKMAQNYTLNILDSIGTHANTTLVAYLRNLTQSGFQYNQPLNMNLRELATEVYTHVQTLNLTDTAINTTWGAGKGLLLMIMKVLTLILMILTNMSNVFMCSTIVLLLLSSENDWLEIAIARLPAMVGHFPVQSEDISRVVEGALLLPVLTAHMRAVSTTVVLFILGSGYGNMAALVVFISTFVPILYPIVVLMPWVLAEAIMGNWYHVTALCVWGLVMLPYLESMMQTVVMKDFGQLHVNPYVTTLVMFSAWSVIGTRGIVYGPLVLLILCEITKFYYKKGDNELNFRTTTPMKKKYSDWHHIKSE